VNITECPNQVMPVLRTQRGGTEGIAFDSHRCRQGVRLHCSFVLRQASTQYQPENANGQQRQDNKGAGKTGQTIRRPSHVGGFATAKQPLIVCGTTIGCGLCRQEGICKVFSGVQKHFPDGFRRHFSPPSWMQATDGCGGCGLISCRHFLSELWRGRYFVLLFARTYSARRWAGSP